MMEQPGYDGLGDEPIAALVDLLPQLRALDLAHSAGWQPALNTGQSLAGFRLGCIKVVAAASDLTACGTLKGGVNHA